jgi:transketolase
VLKSGWRDKLAEVKAKFVADKPKIATRQASGDVLGALVPAIPTLVGGSADLTPSNNTYVKGQKVIDAADFSGTYIHYGIREQGMASAMSGMALHGGIVPYGGTFLIFSDYARPAIRLAALMKQRVVYVFTHDSIGLGEDGPTHQPVEHLAALRAIPNLHVFRPADALETAECWELALTNESGPSVLALSRQGLPALRDKVGDNLSARGAYVLAEAEDGARQVTLLATGSEVSLAMEARRSLAAKGVRAAVVSMPCWKLFETQDKSYRDQVLGAVPRVAVEAAVRLGWDRYIGADGAFIGMTGFGESGPAPELFKHFGITSDAVADAAIKQIKG